MRVMKNNRRGASAVEFAFVAPIIFLFIFAGIEFARGMMAFHTVESAAAEGCRECTLAGATTADVEARVQVAMEAAGITDYTVAIEPTDFAAVDEMAPVTVTVTANYDDFSWLPAPSFLDGIVLVGSCTLPREAQLE